MFINERSGSLSSQPLTEDDLLQLHESVMRHSCINVDVDGTTSYHLLVTPGLLRRGGVNIFTAKDDDSGRYVVQVAPPWLVKDEFARLVTEINVRN